MADPMRITIREGQEGGGTRDRSEGDEGGGGRHGHGGHEERPEETPVWEWIIAGISLLLVLGAIGFLLYEHFARPQTPPEIVIERRGVAAVPGGWRVEFRARNIGGSTAAGLVVEGTLEAGDSTVETSQTTIDYVPANGHHGGGLFFSHDPARYRLEFSPKGYNRP